MVAAIICFAISALNISFIVHDPTSWFNWVSAVFCFGLASVIMFSR